jgi:hypothetical protein
MNTDAPFLVTEWEWLKLTLRLYALEFCTGEEEVQRFDCDSIPDTIICNISSEHAENMTMLQVPQHDQLAYYQDWANGIKSTVARLVEACPVLQHTFDVETHLIVRLLHPYSPYPPLICEIIGETVRWDEPLRGGETIYAEPSTP